MDILYSDPHIVVCVKPAGVLSQDAGENSMPGLLRRHLGAEEIYVIHRLDREVGGVMVFARSQKAAAGLSRAVQERRLEKIYHAVVRGIPEKASDRLEDLLFHDQRRNKTYVVDRERKGVKPAALTYTLLRTAGEYALVRVQLHTGRTHQIRVQFATRKLPLYGDAKYGGKTPGAGFGLWARELTFPHPVSGEILTFTADPHGEEPWNRFT